MLGYLVLDSTKWLGQTLYLESAKVSELCNGALLLLTALWKKKMPSRAELPTCTCVHYCM